MENNLRHKLSCAYVITPTIDPKINVKALTSIFFIYLIQIHIHFNKKVLLDLHMSHIFFSLNLLPRPECCVIRMLNFSFIPALELVFASTPWASYS